MMLLLLLLLLSVCGFTIIQTFFIHAFGCVHLLMCTASIKLKRIILLINTFSHTQRQPTIDNYFTLCAFYSHVRNVYEWYVHTHRKHIGWKRVNIANAYCIYFIQYIQYPKWTKLKRKETFHWEFFLRYFENAICFELIYQN